MSRIANAANAFTRSATRLGPVDVLFAGLDYADGKAQGEDDIRAASGAVGSTLGGWGGAIGGGWAFGQAGAAIGGAIGSVIPIAGTVAGAAIGGGIGTIGGIIAGGMAGGFGGGYTADRADELIRGNKTNKGNENMATFNQSMKNLYDEQGNSYQVEQKSDGSWGILDSIAAGAGAYGGVKFAQQARNTFTDPRQIFNSARNLGITSGQAMRMAAGNVGADVARTLRRTPIGAKVAGGAALAYGANKMLGNPLGGVIDAVTENRTDFDGKGRPPTQNSANYARDQREANQAYGIPNYQMPLSPEQQARINADYAREIADIDYYRGLSKAREQDERYLRRRAMELRAEQARDLTTAFSSSIPNSVANRTQAIMQSNFN